MNENAVTVTLDVQQNFSNWHLPIKKQKSENACTGRIISRVLNVNRKKIRIKISFYYQV